MFQIVGLTLQTTHMPLSVIRPNVLVNIDCYNQLYIKSEKNTLEKVQNCSKGIPVAMTKTGASDGHGNGRERKLLAPKPAGAKRKKADTECSIPSDFCKPGTSNANALHDFNFLFAVIFL